jgi:hypothetical protein
MDLATLDEEQPTDYSCRRDLSTMALGLISQSVPPPLLPLPSTSSHTFPQDRCPSLSPVSAPSRCTTASPTLSIHSRSLPVPPTPSTNLPVPCCPLCPTIPVPQPLTPGPPLRHRPPALTILHSCPKWLTPRWPHLGKAIPEAKLSEPCTVRAAVIVFKEVCVQSQS